MDILFVLVLESKIPARPDGVQADQGISATYGESPSAVPSRKTAHQQARKARS
jgi:hypothetical protein